MPDGMTLFRCPERHAGYRDLGCSDRPRPHSGAPDHPIDNSIPLQPKDTNQSNLNTQRIIMVSKGGFSDATVIAALVGPYAGFGNQTFAPS
jgi:hypothetical protein